MAKMPNRKDATANLGFEAKLWAAADALRATSCTVAYISFIAVAI